MKPTSTMRWEHIKPVEGARFDELKMTFKVLQQWWEGKDVNGNTHGEWRDIQVVDEE
jgi:hypothetical protein